MITATGLGSGLDITGLVDQIVAAERLPSDRQISRKSSKLATQLSAFGSLKSVVSGFQGSLSSLNNLDSFDKKSVTLSKADAFTATASASAVVNTYNVEVQQLADAHALASTAYADSDTAAVGTGTLTFRFGTVDYNTGTGDVDAFTQKENSKVTTIAIDSGNNTLEGIMQAVNDADFGVQASVVNDGSGYRLLFTSTQTGAKNAIEIAVDDDDLNDTDTAGLSNLTFNTTASNVVQTKAARDAQLTLNGLAVTSESNSVSSAIPGVTLTLKDVTAGAVEMKVTQNTAAVTSAVKGFINGYNSFNSTVKNLTKYDADTGTAGALIGDFTVRAIVSQIDSIMKNTVEGLTTEFGSLTEIGITTDSTGNYILDTAKFDAALKSSPQAIQALFTALGIPSDSQVSYKGATDDTLTGDYAVNVTSLATSGSYTGAGVLPADFGATPLLIDADNDALTLEVDGVAVGEILLTHGSYSSGASLATEIQGRINGADAMVEAGKTVAVAYDAGSNAFIITSDSVGNASTVNITAVDTNTAAELGFSVAGGVDGVDIDGTIDGVAATGGGNLLTAGDGTDAKGLQLEIIGGGTGARGTVNFSRGVASQLDMLLSQMLEEGGGLTSRIETLENNMDDLEARAAALELRWEKVRDRYTRQFNALDTLLSSMQATSSFLQDQLAALPKPNSIRSNNN